MNRFCVVLLIVGSAVISVTASAAGFGKAVRVDDVDEHAMAVDLEGDRLYVAAGTHLTVFDVSKPLMPLKLGELEGVDNRRQLVARNGIVYLVSRETGMRIIDCTDPAKPKLRSRYDSIEFATGIEVVGGTAFLSERINGVEFVDVSDLDNPTHVAIRKTGESQSSRYRGGYLYSGEWGVGEVTVFDVRDLKSIREVCRLHLHGFGDGLEISGNHLYCSTGHDAKHSVLTGEEAVGRGRGMDIFELTDPAHPRHVGRVDFPRFKPRNDDYWTVRVAQGVAFCADSHNGLFAVDVSDPSAPRVIDRFCIPQRNQPDWPSAAISSLAIGHGCLYVTAAPGGLYVVPYDGVSPELCAKGREPINVGWRESYATDDSAFRVYRPEARGQARTAAVKGDFIYAAFGDAGLHVLKIDDSGAFAKVGELSGRKVYDCAFSGERLLTAEGVDGFALYELDGAAGFREVARRSRISSSETVAFWVWTYDDKAVLTSRNGALRFIRADDLAKEQELASYRFSCLWDKYLCDRPLGGRLPVVRPSRGLIWLDLSGDKPMKISEDGSVTPKQTNGVCALADDTFLVTVMSRYALVGRDGQIKGGLRSWPGEPGCAGVPRTDGRFVAVTSRSAKMLALYDFEDRENPRRIGGWKLSGNPDLAAFHQGRLIVPAGYQGLLIRR